MACAAVDRLVKGRKSRQRKARWPAKLKAMQVTCAQRIAQVEKEANRRVGEALDREAEMAIVNADQRDELNALYENGPAVVEIVQVKQSNVFARLWWAFWFAMTRKLRFERLVEGS